MVLIIYGKLFYQGAVAGISNRQGDPLNKILYEFYSKTVEAKTSFKLTSQAYLLIILALGIGLPSFIMLQQS